MLGTTMASLTTVRRRHAGLAATAGVLAIAVFAALGVSADAAQFQPGFNGQLVFTRNLGAGNDDVFVMGSDGSNPTNLTANSTQADLQASFSPDGQTIVFDRAGQLFSMSASGANQTLLTTGFQATFTPDGSKVVFTRTDPTDSDIFTMNPNGTGLVNLTGGSPAQDQNPNVSPDGTKIVFTSDRDGGDFDLFTMNLDGSNPTNLTPGSALNENNAYYSPSGQQIVFQRVLGGGDTDIFLMNADGSNETNLTAADPFSEAHPAFSPDGTKISFTRSAAGGMASQSSQDVYVMNADGSGQTNLTPDNPTTSDREAEWQRLEVAQANCVVPDVVGKKKKKAAAAIVAANCTVGATKKKFSKKVKKKKVIKTKPAAGTTLPAGAPVDLKVSKGKKKG